MNYLSANELAELIECKPNSKSVMIAWLTAHHWRFEIARSGLPKVARAYHDRKMGILEGKTQAKYDDAPNRQAFL
ncbi:DUF4224 domain-containing protein [Undibacterium arcticum]|uniref:DUF4224 domain-containing protein n=1 Tax=Undibacterium arcticum TaxID=1762892 RepID=A0ABV7EZQ1_9BURK